MNKYTITQSYHKVKNKPIWLVKPSERLDAGEYRSVESKIKQIGGYYSRFTHSFVFEKEPSEQQLDEVFGDTRSISEKASTAGVSQSKLALIPMGGSFQAIDKRTLRSEYNAGKLLVGKRRFFDGYTDSYEFIPESDMKWSEKDAGFERQFEYEKRAYVSGDSITIGDYQAKYKPEITIPEKTKTKRLSSLNYYVDVDYVKQIDPNTTYKLDRVDSKRNDLEEGERIVMSMYGNKYCGFITKKEVRKYLSTSWTYGSNPEKKEEQSVIYSVQLDNGVKSLFAEFKVDTDNECDEISADAILLSQVFVLAEYFWSSEIVGLINTINRLRRQKAARKKAQYAIQDQKEIDAREIQLFRNCGLWLAWEKENYEYSRQITGETPEEQIYRTEKWMQEYSIIPQPLVRPKDVVIANLKTAISLLSN